MKLGGILLVWRSTRFDWKVIPTMSSTPHHFSYFEIGFKRKLFGFKFFLLTNKSFFGRESQCKTTFNLKDQGEHFSLSNHLFLAIWTYTFSMLQSSDFEQVECYKFVWTSQTSQVCHMYSHTYHKICRISLMSWWTGLNYVSKQFWGHFTWA